MDKCYRERENEREERDIYEYHYREELLVRVALLLVAEGVPGAHPIDTGSHSEGYSHLLFYICLKKPTRIHWRHFRSNVLWNTLSVIAGITRLALVADTGTNS